MAFAPYREMTGMSGILRLGLAAVIIDLVLIQPNHPGAMTPQALLLFPLELPVILFGLMALPALGRIAALLRLALVSALLVTSLLKLADLGMFSAFGRPFNPVTDRALIPSGVDLAVGSVGGPLVVLAAILAVVIMGAVAAALWWATGCWAALHLPARWRGASAVAAGLSAVVATAEIGQTKGHWTLPIDPPGAAFSARLAGDRVALYRATMADLRTFERAAQSDPFASPQGLFDLLGGQDVMIVFVESYGRTSFDNPIYADLHPATLRAAETQLADTGLAMRSGWLTSPIAGGQSWLAHGTLASGLEIGNQRRYSAMLGSSRKTLFELAEASGYRTAAIMPAITMAWPEGTRLGFETILAADDLGYGGLPFNWVTMPDQFTLSAFEPLLSGTAPLFAQIVLVSSHAPWVPVPELIDWDEIGDGTIFNAMATAGDTPDQVWRDHDRVRAQYRLAVDYSLKTVLAYAQRRADAPPLMIILGDHQPAGFVSQVPGFDVPVHVIGPPELVARLDDWGWADGLVPDAGTPAWPMATFRDRFIAAFSSTTLAVTH